VRRGLLGRGRPALAYLRHNANIMTGDSGSRWVVASVPGATRTRDTGSGEFARAAVARRHAVFGHDWRRDEH
jgi:hypothetical protein